VGKCGGVNAAGSSFFTARNIHAFFLQVAHLTVKAHRYNHSNQDLRGSDSENNSVLYLSVQADAQSSKQIISQTA
jgi:hypothetical protein